MFNTSPKTITMQNNGLQNNGKKDDLHQGKKDSRNVKNMEKRKRAYKGNKMIILFLKLKG